MDFLRYNVFKLMRMRFLNFGTHLHFYLLGVVFKFRWSFAF